MIKKDKIVYVILAIIIVILVVIISWQILGKKSSSYYAIFLNNGNMYFGQLERFSRYTLINPYFLTVTEDPENPFIIQRFRDAFWGPSQKVNFNPQNVIWISKLNSDSPVISYIQGRESGTIPAPKIQAPEAPQTPGAGEETTPSE